MTKKSVEIQKEFIAQVNSFVNYYAKEGGFFDRWFNGKTEEMKKTVNFKIAGLKNIIKIDDVTSFNEVYRLTTDLYEALLKLSSQKAGTVIGQETIASVESKLNKILMDYEKNQRESISSYEESLEKITKEKAALDLKFLTEKESLEKTISNSKQALHDAVSTSTLEALQTASSHTDAEQKLKDKITELEKTITDQKVRLASVTTERDQLNGHTQLHLESISQAQGLRMKLRLFDELFIPVEFRKIFSLESIDDFTISRMVAFFKPKLIGTERAISEAIIDFEKTRLLSLTSSSTSTPISGHRILSNPHTRSTKKDGASPGKRKAEERPDDRSRSKSFKSSARLFQEPSKNISVNINRFLDEWIGKDKDDTVFEETLKQSKKEFLASKKSKKFCTGVHKNYGLTVKDISGDGNCFFYAMLDQIRTRNLTLPVLAATDNSDHRTLRALAVNELLRLAQGEELQEYTSNPDEFILRASTDKEWADDFVISTLARVLGITIVLINSDGNDPTIIDGGREGVVYLAYQVGIHFQSLIGDPNERLLDYVAEEETSDFQASM